MENIVVLVGADHQYRLAGQRMKRIGNQGCEGQKPALWARFGRRRAALAIIATMIQTGKLNDAERLAWVTDVYLCASSRGERRIIN